jgi:hypothetical protein
VLNFSEDNILEKIDLLTSFVQLLFVPFIVKLLSVELICNAYKNGHLSNALIYADARKILSR